MYVIEGAFVFFVEWFRRSVLAVFVDTEIVSFEYQSSALEVSAE